MVCAFLGEYECPETIRPRLKWLVMSLAMAMEKPIFLVGTHTALEKEVLSVLREVQREYWGIQYGVVTTSAEESLLLPGELTVCPEAIIPGDAVDAIMSRNQWLIGKASVVIYNWKDDTDEFCQMILRAKEIGKDVINISADLPE